MIIFAMKTESDNWIIMDNIRMKHLIKAFVALFLFLVVAQVGYAQTIRNSSNSMMAKIESDGTVRNRSNSYLGRVYSDGTVRNSSNSVIGYAKDVPMQYAALYFFFNFF